MLKLSSFDGNLQMACDTAAATNKQLVVEYRDDPYVLAGPLVMRSGLRLRLDAGVQLVAKEDEFLGKFDCLLWAKLQSGIEIEGYGATLCMRQDEYTTPPYVPSEHRHGIGLRACEDVDIRGLQIEETGGDGVYVGPTWEKPDSGLRKPCRDITIQHVTTSDTYRNGVSLVSVDGCSVTHCTMQRASGTSPMGGLVVEPSAWTDWMHNISVSDCQFLYNGNWGVQVQAKFLNEKSPNISVDIDNCLVADGTSIVGVAASRWGSQLPPGHIRLNVNVRNIIGRAKYDDFDWGSSPCALEMPGRR